MKKKSKGFKPKIEVIGSKHILDVWKMFKRCVETTHPDYPDITEVEPSQLRSHLLGYLMNPNFIGLIIKIGRKPIGQILGNVSMRPFGRPSKYCFIWNFWIEPEFRKKGYVKLLFNEYAKYMKERGVHYWEAEAQEELTKFLTGYKKYKTTELHRIIGGKAVYIKEA